MMKREASWYKVQNSADVATIDIYEGVGKSADGGGVSAKSFIEELRGINASTIKLSLNSAGGSVFEGFAIYNALKSHRARVEVTVSGLAASIASVIAMAGDTVTMPENAMMMVHSPWTIAAGNASDFRKTAEMLDKTSLGIVAAYRGKTGLDTARINELMEAETWMTAAEAQALGFCDEVTGATEIRASACTVEALKQYNHTPADLLTRINNTTKGNQQMTNQTSSTETALRREYDRDHTLQAEFGDFERYSYFRQAEAAGQIKLAPVASGCSKTNSNEWRA